MSLIEGIGDEVTHFFIALFAVLVVYIAWWSTNISEQRQYRTVLLLDRRRRPTRSIVRVRIPRRLSNHTETVTISEGSSTSNTTPTQIEAASVSSEITNTTPEVTLPQPKPELSSRSNTEEDSDSSDGSEARVASRLNSIEEIEEKDIIKKMDAETQNVLRQRRIAHFEGVSEGISGSSTNQSEESQLPQSASDTEETEEFRGIKVSPIREIGSSGTESCASDIGQVTSGTTQPSISADNKQIKINPMIDIQTGVPANISEQNKGLKISPIREVTPRAHNSGNEDGPTVTIKLKYINDDIKIVDGRLDELLGDFKKRHFEQELNSNKIIKLIFNGQVLKQERHTLRSCGLFDNCVVHCLIHQKRPSLNENQQTESSRSTSEFFRDNPFVGVTNLNNNNQGIDWDLGNFLFALVSFILLAAWYFRYVYAHLYTVTATVGLIIITGVFSIVLVGTYFPDNEMTDSNTRIRIARAERIEVQQQ